jgi:hypothetical protein
MGSVAEGNCVEREVAEEKCGRFESLEEGKKQKGSVAEWNCVDREVWQR